MAETPEPNPDLLDGWKSIADYLGKSVRTAQRWKAEFGLPVHRLGAREGENVFAYRSELEAWRRAQKSGEPRGEDANPEPAQGGVPQESDRRHRLPARTLKYRCQSCPAGEPTDFFVFPRSPMIDALRGFPSIGFVMVTTTGDILPNVMQGGAVLPDRHAYAWGDCNYRLDSRFRLVSAEHSTEYRLVQRYDESIGLMKPEDSVGDDTRLWPVLRWNRERQAFDRIDGPER